MAFEEVRKWGVRGAGLHSFLWYTHLLWAAIALSESQTRTSLQGDSHYHRPSPQVTRDAGRGAGEGKSPLSPGTLPAVEIADWQ